MGTFSESESEFTWKLSIKAHTSSCSIYVQTPQVRGAGCLWTGSLRRLPHSARLQKKTVRKEMRWLSQVFNSNERVMTTVNFYRRLPVPVTHLIPTQPYKVGSTITPTLQMRKTESLHVSWQGPIASKGWGWDVNTGNLAPQHPSFTSML